MSFKPATRVAAWVLLPMGLIFLVVYALVIVFVYFPDVSAALAFSAFGITGGTMLIIGAVMWLISGRLIHLLDRLKREGTPYEARITNTSIPTIARVGPLTVRTGVASVRIGPWSNARIVCAYTDEYGAEHTLRSHSFMVNFTNPPFIRVRVWVDRQLPEIRAVEVYE